MNDMLLGRALHVGGGGGGGAQSHHGMGLNAHLLRAKQRVHSSHGPVFFSTEGRRLRKCALAVFGVLKKVVFGVIFGSTLEVGNQKFGQKMHGQSRRFFRTRRRMAHLWKEYFASSQFGRRMYDDTQPRKTCIGRKFPHGENRAH